MTQVSAELKGDTKRQGGRKVQPFRRKVLAEAMAEHVMEESKTFVYEAERPELCDVSV